MLENRKFVRLYSAISKEWQSDFDKLLPSICSSKEALWYFKKVKKYFDLPANSPKKVVLENEIEQHSIEYASNIDDCFSLLLTKLNDYLLYKSLLNDEKQKNNLFLAKRYELLADIYENLEVINLFENSLDRFKLSINESYADELYAFTKLKMNYLLAKDNTKPFLEPLKKQYYNSFFEHYINELLFVIVKANVEDNIEFLPFDSKEFVKIIANNYKHNKIISTQIYVQLFEIIFSKTIDIEIYKSIILQLEAGKKYFRPFQLSNISRLLYKFILKLRKLSVKNSFHKNTVENDINYVTIHAIIVNFMVKNKLYYISGNVPFHNIALVIRTIWKYNAISEDKMDTFRSIDFFKADHKIAYQEEEDNKKYYLFSLMYLWANSKFELVQEKLPLAINAFKRSEDANDLPILLFLQIKCLYKDESLQDKGNIKKVKDWLKRVEKTIGDDNTKGYIILFRYELSIWYFILSCYQTKDTLTNEEGQKTYQTFLTSLSPQSIHFYNDKRWYYQTLLALPNDLSKE